MSDGILDATPPGPFCRAVGNLARPYAMIAIATATAYVIAFKPDVGVIGAAGLLLGTLYGARSVENGFAAHAAAKVEVERAKTPGP